MPQNNSSSPLCQFELNLQGVLAIRKINPSECTFPKPCHSKPCESIMIGSHLFNDSPFFPLRSLSNFSRQILILSFHPDVFDRRKWLKIVFIVGSQSFKSHVDFGVTPFHRNYQQDCFGLYAAGIQKGPPLPISCSVFINFIENS
jgi:hypothetical protein